MKCSETRKTPYGIKRRRYKREGVEDLTTYEIPETVARAIGLKAISRWMDAWKRGEAKRELVAYRVEYVRQRINWKPAAIANELGISTNRVQAIAKQIRNAEQASQGNPRRDAGSPALREVDRDPADHGRHD